LAPRSCFVNVVPLRLWRFPRRQNLRRKRKGKREKASNREWRAHGSYKRGGACYVRLKERERGQAAGGADWADALAGALRLSAAWPVHVCLPRVADGKSARALPGPNRFSAREGLGTARPLHRGKSRAVRGGRRRRGALAFVAARGARKSPLDRRVAAGTRRSGLG